jgi:hypothetical protein
VEVLNFGITGYGPNQYLAVFEEYGPRYRPDLVIVGLFVNDFFDVLMSDEEFRSSIGFSLRPQNSVSSYLGASNLRRWLQLTFGAPIREFLTRSPRIHGYDLGHFRSLEVDSSEMVGEGFALLEERMTQMRETCRSIDAVLAIVLIPASVQICGPNDLRYYPRFVNVTDPAQFDMEQPQSLALEIAGTLDLPVYDLRGPLEVLDHCPYQPLNMHWTEDGHRAAADFLADVLIRDGHVPLPTH